MIKDLGVNWAIVGHSERRSGFGFPGEPNEVVGKKVAVALSSGLSVIACIGEKLHHREEGTTLTVLGDQLSAIASHIRLEEWSRVVVAYKPVWAIGTGKVATPEQAEETHAAIRHWIADNVSPEVAAAVRVIYGGSVKASNCKALIACPNIDGFLVGGASITREFLDIAMVRKLIKMAGRITNLTEFLTRFPVVKKIPVQWGDMDAFQHLNNTVYFKFQESSRIRYFKTLTDEARKINPRFDPDSFNLGKDIGPILSETQIKFIVPLIVDDIVLVGATAHMVENSRNKFKLSHSFWSLKRGRVAAEGTGTIAAFNYQEGKAAEFPQFLIEAVNNISKKNMLHMEQEILRKDDLL